MTGKQAGTNEWKRLLQREKPIMIAIKWRAGLTVLVLILVMPLGCRQRAQQSEPEQARETLRRALDAWQKGESQDALQKQASITAVDPHWQAGVRLLQYEIIGDGQTSGFDWQCQVRLSLQDNGGNSLQVKAAYTISTAPALVIVRSEDS
jgi:hypothetical protein